MEDMLRDLFLLDLFKGAITQIPKRAVTYLPVNQDRITLPEPTQTSRYNCTASCVITVHPIAALRRTDEFRSGDHALLMGEGRYEI